MNPNKYQIDKLSVFFPCYNEEKNITTTVNKAVKVLENTAKEWEILLIDDGSKDNTPQILKKISQTNKNITVITHNPNRGYGAALKSGLYNSKYPWITFTDSDGQFDFSEIKKLIKKQKATQADLVIGFYKGRKVAFYRILGSKLWQFAVFFLFGLRVKDIDCGFKLIRKKVIDEIPKLESERGPFISSELLIKAKKSGFKIIEIGVSHFSRTEGEATGTKLNVIIAGFKDLIRLWYKTNFSK